MSCPVAVRVLVPSGPAVVRVVTPGPPGTSTGGGASLSDAAPLPLAAMADPGESEEASRADHEHALPSAQQVGADPTGTAAAAIASHLAAADPHSQYTTPQEAAAAAPVQSVALSLPTGWTTQATSTGGNVTLSLALPTGQTLLATADKTAWDAAAVLAGTAVQPATLATGLAGKADLVGGVIPSSQLPALAITEYLGAVANQAALLALTGQRGDWAIRLDKNSVWILSADVPTQLVNWVELPIPSGVVLQVNGQTGVVTLAAGDVGADPAGTASSAITAHLLAASHLSQAQVRGSLSATLPIAYNSSTGVIGANTDDSILIIFGEDSTPLTVSTLRTIIWPEPTQLYAIPLWNVSTAPTGAACQFDIRVGGTSIFSTLPTIAAGGTLSSATTPAVFSAAFVAASQTIAQGASVSFHCLQIGTGSGVAVGAGLKGALYTRRVYS